LKKNYHLANRGTIGRIVVSNASFYQKLPFFLKFGGKTAQTQNFVYKKNG
jgi:hypothetical protein